MPLTSAESTRSVTSPKIAKLDRWTLRAGVGRRVAVHADAGPVQHAVPGACAGQRHVVDHQVRGDRELTGRKVDRAVLLAAGVDRVLDRRGRVGLAARVGAERQHGQRPLRLPGRRRDLLEVRDVDRDRDRRVGDLEPHLGSAGQRPAEHRPHVVVHVVAVQVGRVVGERVAAVEPGVFRGEGQVRAGPAVHQDVQRRGQAGAVGGVGDRVAQVNGVRRPGEGELDVLAGPAEGDRGAGHGFGGQRVEVVGRADHRAVGVRAHGGVLGERDLRAAAVGRGRHHRRVAGSTGPGGRDAGAGQRRPRPRSGGQTGRSDRVVRRGRLERAGARQTGRCRRGTGRARPRGSSQCDERGHHGSAAEDACGHGPSTFQPDAGERYGSRCVVIFLCSIRYETPMR